MKPKLALEKTQAYQVVVDGVPVNLTVDCEGRLLHVGSGWPDDGDADYERRVELALAKVAVRVQSARAKASSAKAAAESAKKRASATANEWLAKAHREHPEYGRDKLTLHARQLAAKARVELAKRNEITEERAKLFLKRQGKARSVEK